MKNTEDWIIILVMIVVCLMLALVTHVGVTNSWEKEAIKEGHAEYYLDKDHNRQWRWLPVKKELK